MPDDKNLEQNLTDTKATDPLGPVTLPKNNSKVGARALALMGTTGMAALAAGVILGQNSTPTHI
ncbi:hypothetical protein AB0P21_22075 [Kribbella sp. NPDC056861]|uniref:hypothetical protein n=1 Tax=Kribbella sp. NPDC056861 TaxID=3154857 RepID=UPI0034381D89